MNNAIRFLLAILAGTVSSNASTETSPTCCTMPEPVAAAVLLEVDRAFNARAQDSDVPTAFLEFAAEDAVMYRNGMEPLQGKEAIARVLQAESGVKLVWEPLTAEIAGSGDLGYTRGSFTYYTSPGADGATPQGPFAGYYVSIWKLQPDGSWKWVFDSGIISKMPGK